MTEFMRKHLTLYRVFRAAIILAVVIGFFWYVTFQSRLLIAGPSITLTNNPEIVREDRVVTVEGTAQNVVFITLNGRPIFIDERGHFRQLLVLQDGYTIMTIRAEDRYGREIMLERPFVYLPASARLLERGSQSGLPVRYRTQTGGQAGKPQT